MHYPTTLAPVSGSKRVTVQCADNAHSISLDMIAWCVSGGSWVLSVAYMENPPFPNCECDTGYRVSVDQ